VKRSPQPAVDTTGQVQWSFVYHH